MLISVSWRNIWRNRIRSSVIIASIAVGISAGVFAWAFYRGMVTRRIQAVIETEVSNIQIHHKEFMEDPDAAYDIPYAENIAEDIRKVKGVDALSTRVLANAMASSADKGSGVKIIGIDPAFERKVTNLFTRITAGSYFENHGKTPVLIGEELAKKLSVRLGSRIVLTMQQVDGTITAGLFRVEGMYKSSNTSYDEGNVFIRKDQLRGLLGLEDHVAHELAIVLQDNDQLSSMQAILKNNYPELDIRTWREILPEVSVVESTMDLYMNIFMGIIVIALIFGIVNTMLMAILDRVKEVGMLMAIGKNKVRVCLMNVLETVFLALTGGGIGITAGCLLTVFYGGKGIDLSLYAEVFDKLGYESMVYPVIQTDIVMKISMMIITAGIIASVYPAYRAIQLRPSEALRTDV